jgi:hypothetical protein
MSYNGSGTFQINSTGQPVVGGTIISSSTFNALTADLATGLTTAITKDGQTATTARIPFAQGITSTLVTDASSTTTGSIITAGGVGIAKKLYVGTDANIAGTLGVTGVATFSATPIYSSLTASSAVATDASKALVSVTNTGTGSNVLATGPTIASLNLTTALTLAGAAGSSGHVLTSAGSGLPTWSPPSAALSFLSTVTINNSATADVETTFNSTYNTYMIVGRINTTTGANPILQCQLKIGGSYVATNYAYQVETSNAGSASYVGIAATNADQINMTPTLGADASYSVDFVMYVQNPTSTTEEKSVFWTGRCRNSTPNLAKANGQGAYTGSTAALTGVRFFTSSDNLVSGYVRLYGIAKS